MARIFSPYSNEVVATPGAAGLTNLLITADAQGTWVYDVGTGQLADAGWNEGTWQGLAADRSRGFVYYAVFNGSTWDIVRRDLGTWANRTVLRSALTSPSNGFGLSVDPASGYVTYIAGRKAYWMQPDGTAVYTEQAYYWDAPVNFRAPDNLYVGSTGQTYENVAHFKAGPAYATYGAEYQSIVLAEPSSVASAVRHVDVDGLYVYAAFHDKRGILRSLLSTTTNNAADEPPYDVVSTTITADARDFDVASDPAFIWWVENTTSPSRAHLYRRPKDLSGPAELVATLDDTKLTEAFGVVAF